MRLLSAAAVAALIYGCAAGQAEAQDQWCAYYDAYTYNCGFRTFEQCLATVSGAGGVCRRNPFAAERPAPESRDRRSRDREPRR
jgi:hydrogenase/urease accessory protein HupE